MKATPPRSSHIPSVQPAHTNSTARSFHDMKATIDKSIDAKIGALSDALSHTNDQVKDLIDLVKLMRRESIQFKAEITALKASNQRLQQNMSSAQNVVTECMQNMTTMEHSLAVIKVDDVYEKVMSEINTNLVPQMNKAMSFMHRNLEDHDEVINQYRYGVCKKYPVFNETNMLVRQ